MRIEIGVHEGAEVTLDDDPLIAKLCTWGENSGQAIARMSAALDAFELRGPGHNISFLASVMARPSFVAGRYDTGLIEQEYGDSFAGEAIEGGLLELLLTPAVLGHIREQAPANPRVVRPRLEGGLSVSRARATPDGSARGMMAET